MKSLYLSLLAAALSCGKLAAQTPQLNLVPFGAGFFHPIGIAHANDSRLFVLEQPGRIVLLDSLGVRNLVPFLNITSQVNSSGTEQGLLGLAFHPDYATNGYFFVNYTNLQGNTVVSRFRVSANPDAADPASEQIVLTIPQPYTNHNGGHLAFGPDGYLYIGMGDGGSAGDPQGNAQNGQSLLGKMLRLNVNQLPYTIPADNPFVNDPNVRDEVWAMGYRNPWRWSFDRQTGDLWIGDVGQNAWEEIDFEPAGTGGRNYGWRCYEGNNTFNATGCQPQGSYVAPVAEYSHSGGGCSVTGGYVYRGSQYPLLQGHYLYTDYCTGQFWSLRPDGAGGFVNTSLGQFLPLQHTSFGEDRAGELYLTGRGNGNVYKIQATFLGTPEPAVAAALELYPNPNTGQFSARFRLEKQTAAALEVLNALGQVVSRQQVQLQPGLQELPVQLHNEAAGLYLLRLRTPEGTRTVRFSVE